MTKPSDDIEKAVRWWLEVEWGYDEENDPLLAKRVVSLTALVREQLGLIQSRLTASQELHASARDRIVALEAALEKAKTVEEFLLDEALYPLHYSGRLRALVLDAQVARTKVRP